MFNQEKRNQIIEQYQIENIVLFDNHAYDNSIVGVVDSGDGENFRAVYSYERMVQEYMEDEGCDELDAVEWIEYNTMRALPYAGEYGPIIMNEIDLL